MSEEDRWVRCNHCEWEGPEDELDRPNPDLPEDEDNHERCPTCKENDALMDIPRPARRGKKG